MVGQASMRARVGWRRRRRIGICFQHSSQDYVPVGVQREAPHLAHHVDLDRRAGVSRYMTWIKKYESTSLWLYNFTTQVFSYVVDNVLWVVNSGPESALYTLWYPAVPAGIPNYNININTG